MKKLLATLLVLITLFTATTGLASSLEDKLTSGLWISGQGYYVFQFTKKDGKLVSSLTDISEGYAEARGKLGVDVEIVSEFEIRMANKTSYVYFEKMEWKYGTDIIMHFFNEDGTHLEWYTQSSAVFDDLTNVR